MLQSPTKKSEENGEEFPEEEPSSNILTSIDVRKMFRSVNSTPTSRAVFILDRLIGLINIFVVRFEGNYRIQSHALVIVLWGGALANLGKQV